MIIFNFYHIYSLIKNKNIYIYYKNIKITVKYKQFTFKKSKFLKNSIIDTLFNSYRIFIYIQKYESKKFKMTNFEN